jgi:hypothetical protein
VVTRDCIVTKVTSHSSRRCIEVLFQVKKRDETRGVFAGWQTMSNSGQHPNFIGQLHCSYRGAEAPLRKKKKEGFSVTLIPSRGHNALGYSLFLN